MVTGISPDIPEQFDIKLIPDKEKYPADMHYHNIDKLVGTPSVGGVDTDYPL